MENRSPGYSNTPLVKKLGLKESHRVLLIAAPEDYVSLLEPLPAGVTFVKKADATVDVVQVFVTRKEELAKRLGILRHKLNPEASLWISWPKKASGVPTSVSDGVIRELALPLGWVDIKVCAVTEVWSGLKLVVRKELRGG
ncbi:conserved hypothetical protein [Chthoniobacter flavus Ellin428]|uniref:DUF3052 domain-containing protein n=1 Tax=Chthoniobacter flavus Ellin428 TaxID=497964 RepID=B4D2H8_9BACT|nr:DUF3052 family protein [Chthoniobacter flavus]EDY19418.1 conserved hypothetical protein [Chthoniobacter flavus Ellin428]TCO90455.1 DUF3052 family protein [Chthoniobacter flavus]